MTHSVNQPALVKYRNRLIQKQYSANTVKVYLSYFADFVRFFNESELDCISTDRINNYLLHLVEEYHISVSQQNQRINAIKFYYEKILGRDRQYFILHRPRKEHKLPKVLAKQEISKIFDSCNNTKHRCILMMIYSAGLRRSELINLHITDIDSKRMVVVIQGSKGKKDRISLFSEHMLSALREYYIQYRP
ncbi:MAG: tyrosine-type recombinase/integrase, partial [Candidatus Fermentibacteraceae bacterium]|nr:tyrosine-type recombinase/integrase [Candidatus Fermentibacteraceae bacterium]